MKQIYEELADEFESRAYTWRIDGEAVVPAAEDIEMAVDRAIGMLYSQPNGSILEVGRLIIQKNNKTYDIYMHIGETE